MKLIRTSTIPLSLYVLLKGQLSFLSRNFEILGVSSSGETLLKIKNREGVRVFAIDMERGISPVKDFVSLVKMYRLLRKEKPMIIHSITPKAGLLSMLAGKFSGVPIRMHTFTGLIFPSRTGFMQKLLICMDQLLCWAATNIYPEGQGVKNDLINYKITQKTLKILVNGNVNGLDTDSFNRKHFSVDQIQKLKVFLKIHEDNLVFIFVGRLVKDKGINELVDAFKQINKVNSATKLLLVGPFERELDPLTKETEQEIESNPSIITVGFQKDVRPYLAISDIFVFPSYREGFPNVVMQAGAMGLPSIVTDINGSNEIIVNGKNGIIIPSKHTQELKEAMLRLLKDKELRSSLAENARPMIESRYQQEVVWNAILEEYNKLIAEMEKK